MTRNIALLLIALTLPFAGCDKVPGLKNLKKKQPVVEATPTPVPVAVAEPVAEPESPAEPPAPAINTKAEVVVLCYHRLEGKAGGALSIEPALFEQQLQKIKESDAEVISMQDFLAWRRGEKSIPAKSIIITIDDGYVSGYDVGWPLLKKYGFPFTMFVYLNYIEKGGKSITWAQLAEMRDAGVDIGSHSISHQDLRRKPSKAPGDYDSWLKAEMEQSKQVIEEKLGIKCATMAYPFGLHNDKVHAALRAAGYEAGFTTYGARLGMTTDAATLGRYDVTTKDARGTDSFTVALSFQGMAAPGGSPVMAQDAAVSTITEPLNGEVITNPTPTLKVNLATMGALDKGTVVMRVSGLGPVPAEFDEASKNLSYTIPNPLRPGSYTVIVAAKAKGRPVETRWAFTFNPDGASAPADPSPELPARKKR
jgi:peptidoglycan/xylan/chitin deacetylase (PgdA/CDA1 family)